ncbi:MAG TPA: DUF5915 domain-containing protein, partial [Trueperaceae bacterium]|nr:DUF5915 domain-containing protein [Trueperaceae bacterium]
LVLSVDTDAPVSVHLAQWPEASSASAADREARAALLRDMRALQKVIELGRAARAASGVKLRQPLSEVLIRVRNADELAGVRALRDQLSEELNVKDVRFLGVNDSFVDYQVKPNLPRLGKRLGRQLPAIRAALAAMDGRVVAASVNAGDPIAIEVDGQTLALEPEDVLLDAVSPEGFAAEEDRGYLAALNTTVTQELLREGLSRDVVRLVQNARKTAGLDVSDRIELRLTADGELGAALEEHRGSIAAEVLATSLVLGERTAAEATSAAAQTHDIGTHRESHDVGGQTLDLTLRKAD